MITSCRCGCGGALRLKKGFRCGRSKEWLPGHHGKPIRQLLPGEPVPACEPRRYKSSHGYIRLRWGLGDGTYVEAYEHRIIAGVVVEEVHHANRDKADNRPENLQPISRSEHARLHGSERAAYDIDLAGALYNDGYSLTALARFFHVNGPSLMRRLKTHGVTVRSMRDGIKLRRSIAEQLEEIHGHVLKPVNELERYDAATIRFERSQ